MIEKYIIFYMIIFLTFTNSVAPGEMPHILMHFSFWFDK